MLKSIAVENGKHGLRETAQRSFISPAVPPRRELRVATVVLLGSFLALASTALAQDKTTALSLANVSNTPKGQVMVPVILSISTSELRIGRVTATLSYADKDVTYQRAEKGFILDGINGNAKVTAQKDPSDPNKSTLQIEIATQGEPRRALPEGVMATLFFQIADTASPGTKVDLVVDKIAATDLSEPAKSVQPLTAKNGTIEVIAPENVPYVGCFFFTH